MSALHAAVCAGAVAAALMAGGCGDGGIFDFDCDDERGDAIAALGQPNDTNSYSSDGYYSVTYWWWWRGVAQTFTWGRNVDGCQRSEYRFTPIGNAVQ